MANFEWQKACFSILDNLQFHLFMHIGLDWIDCQTE